MSTLRVQSMKEVYRMMSIQEKKEIFSELFRSLEEDLKKENSLEEKLMISEAMKQCNIHHDTYFDETMPMTHKVWIIPETESSDLQICNIMYDNTCFIFNDGFNVKYLIINSSDGPRDIRACRMFLSDDHEVDLSLYEEGLDCVHIFCRTEKVIYLEIEGLKITYIHQYDRDSFSLDQIKTE